MYVYTSMNNSVIINNHSYLILQCSECGKEKAITPSELRKSKTGNTFCNKSCAAKYNNKVYPKRMKVVKAKEPEICQCKTCNASFEKRRANQIFCSRWCNRSHLMKSYRIRSKKPCPLCGKPIAKYSSGCVSCTKSTYRGDDLTLQDAIYSQHHRSSAFALVRSRARCMIKKLGITCCQSCGYNKHIETCHIKPICDFPEDSLISTINDPKNLLFLCPNCHWEFDKGLIGREGIEPPSRN